MAAWRCCVSTSPVTRSNPARGCFTENAFAGTHNVPPLPGYSPYGGGMLNTVSGVYLTDPTTGLIYPPVYEAGAMT